MQITERLAAFSIPCVIGVVAFLLLFSERVKFSDFLDGAREGLDCAVSLLPSLVAILAGVKMLSASGVTALVSGLLAPLTDKIGVPSELLPLLLTRPFSGSASTGAYSELMKNYGADGFSSFCASVIMGSSDTLVYILGVYFSSVGVKKTRYAFPCAILVMLFTVFFSCFISRLFFCTA